MKVNNFLSGLAVVVCLLMLSASSVIAQVEICDDGIDNTGNLLIDCDDPACAQDPVCLDTDDDGIDDDVDNCPTTPNGTGFGTCYSWSGMSGSSTCDNGYSWSGMSGSCTSDNGYSWSGMSGSCTSDNDCGGSVGSCDMDQGDHYPPGGNGLGDACECESDLDYDGDVDADDVATFLGDFGRNVYFNPCTPENPCVADLDWDGDVDAEEAALTVGDFGRNQYNDSCPAPPPTNW